MLKVYLLMVLMAGSLCAYAQQDSKVQKVTESQVPAAVKSSYAESIGMEVLYWEKVNINVNQERYVATYSAFDPASGQMITRRLRYTPAGILTSTSMYCLAKGQKADSQTLRPQLGTGGVEEAVEQRFEKIMQNATNIVSFEKVVFQPGKAKKEAQISLFRVVSKSKSGVSVSYYDLDLKPFDVNNYPVRVLEISDMDALL